MIKLAVALSAEALGNRSRVEVEPAPAFRILKSANAALIRKFSGASSVS